MTWTTIPGAAGGPPVISPSAASVSGDGSVVACGGTPSKKVVNTFRRLSGLQLSSARIRLSINSGRCQRVGWVRMRYHLSLASTKP